MNRASNLPVATAVVLALAVITHATSALAALGADATSVESDRLQMKSSHRTTAQTGYTVHTLESADGTIVNEYESPSGVIFAVTWKGRTRPNLQQLLGNYFAAYRDAPRTATPAQSRRLVRLENAGLVVHLMRFQRTASGRAYAPALVPSGIDAQQLP